MLSFVDAPENLFNRLGVLGRLIKEASTYQDNQLVNLTDETSGAPVQFASEPDIQALIGSAYIGLLGGVNSVGTLARNVAEQTVNRMVFRDNPQIAQNLQTLNLSTSLAEVVRQMKVAGATVLAMPVTATAQPFTTTNTNTGNGTVVASTRRAVDGLVLENAFSESVLFVCTGDSYSGTATAGNEPIQITGTGSQGEFFAFDWPLGSNSRLSVSAVNGAANNSAGNVLRNSGFDAFTDDTPDDWTIEVGTEGVDFFEESATTFGTGKALRILGDGTTEAAFYQTFGTDNTTTLASLTQYACNLWMRRDGVASANGILAVELIDENDVVILDPTGAPNQFTVTLSGLSTTYTPYNGSFRTPAIMPATVKLRFRLDQAYDAGRSFYMDRAGMGGMSPHYNSGSRLTVFSGSIPFKRGDRTTVAVVNSRGAAGTLNTFQTLWARLFPQVLSSGLLLPSSSVPSISDALI